MAGAHTRLAKRERYSGTDPFIMNEDLKEQRLAGRDGQLAGNATFQDFPERYREFNRNMIDQISRSHSASDLQDMADPRNTHLHSRADDYRQDSRAAVGSFKFGQRSLAHNNGPAKGSGDYMDTVSGVESDISPEVGSASVYAPLDEDSEQGSNGQEYQQVDPQMGPAVNMDDYDAEPDYNCSSCGHNDGYRGGYPYHPEAHPAEHDNGHFDHRNFREDYPPLDEEGAPLRGYDDEDEAGFDVDDQGYYDEADEDDDGENKDIVENYSNGSNGNYNYALWLLLIVLLVVLYVNYYQPNGNGNGHESLVPQ
jgi:hypothetical protein